ncbi:MAG: hypothetical protein CM15mP59_0440 [Flavobacteriaceae bacterium]|nr:MAG: hypothetical protein CM15mP59_0440 [Flavobacteriaceae bacterium]
MMVGIENMFGQSQEGISAPHVRWVQMFTTYVPVTAMLTLHARIIVLIYCTSSSCNEIYGNSIVALHLFSNLVMRTRVMLRVLFLYGCTI